MLYKSQCLTVVLIKTNFTFLLLMILLDLLEKPLQIVEINTRLTLNRWSIINFIKIK